jgi:hypothetical protein
VRPVQRWQHELRIQHIQTVSFGRQRCGGLLQTEFVAAVTSVRRELDEVTATLLGIIAMSGYGTVLSIWNVRAIIAIGGKSRAAEGASPAGHYGGNSESAAALDRTRHGDAWKCAVQPSADLLQPCSLPPP